MNYLKKTEKYSNNRLAWVSLLVMIFCSIDTLFFGTNSDGTVVFIGYIIVLLFAIMEFITCVFIHQQYKISIIIVIILFNIVLTMMFNMGLNLVYAYACVIAIFAYILSIELNFEFFKQYYLKIFDVLSVASLIGYLLHLFGMSLVSKFPIITNSNGVVYYNLFFVVIPQERWGTIFRSYGIFREPGIFALYLIIGILFELYNTKREVNVKRLVCYIMALLITYSTAGYLCAFLLLLTWLCGRMDFTHFQRTKIAVFALVCIAVIAVLSNEAIYNRIFSKLFIENNSLTSRVGAVGINLKIAFRDFFHFVLGNGFDYTNNKFVDIGKTLYGETVHNTNTPLKVLAVYGLPFFIYIVYGIVSFCKKQSNNIITFIGLLFVMFMILCNEDIILNPLLYLLLFYATNKRVKI